MTYLLLADFVFRKTISFAIISSGYKLKDFWYRELDYVVEIFVLFPSR